MIIAIEFVGARPARTARGAVVCWNVSPSGRGDLLVTRPRRAPARSEPTTRSVFEAGETLEVIGRLNTICAAPRRNGSPVEDGAGAAEATPASETSRR